MCHVACFDWCHVAYFDWKGKRTDILALKILFVFIRVCL